MGHNLRFTNGAFFFGLILFVSIVAKAETGVPKYNYNSVYPGMSVDTFKKNTIFKNCIRDTELQKDMNVPEAWTCKTFEPGVAVLLATVWDKKIAMVRVIFGDTPKGTSGKKILAEASWNSINANKYLTGEFANRFGKAMFDMPHKNGLNPLRDTVCAKGTNELECRISGWKDDEAGITAFVFSNVSPKSKKETVAELYLDSIPLMRSLKEAQSP